MAVKIFINYRRDDEAGFTTALYHRLEEAFAPGEVFMDIEGQIRPGDHFERVLNAKLAAANVVLVVIGPRWADLLAVRQGDPQDFVAIEIRAALDQSKRVIPVLVGGALLPRADALPETIRSLVYRQAVGLRPERFKADCQGLISELKDSLAAAEQGRAVKTEPERKDDIRNAEELASWGFVKDQDDVEDLRGHLARFPNGTTERWARAKLDGLVWAGLGSTPTVEQLRDYLDEFPEGRNAKAAQARIAALEREAAEVQEREKEAAGQRAQETIEWRAVAQSTDAKVIQAFLKRWPNGQHAKDAQVRIADLRHGALGHRIKFGVGAMGSAALVLVVFALLRESLESTRSDSALSIQPGSGTSFRDSRANGQPCPTCPEMVVVPDGRFVMGSPYNEPERGSDEVQVSVSIANPFAVGKFAVTRGEFAAFVEETGHATDGGCSWRAPGFAQDDRHPVVCVSWDDAKAYVAWLSKKTGKTYRLPSEAEREYVTRAGTTTLFWWGTSITDQANYNGNPLDENGSWTVPVDSFKPNPWGLYNVHGNVWEWTEDCWNYSNAGNPGNGGARVTGNCEYRIIRGGSWFDYPKDLRSASRHWLYTDVRNDITSFRVGRDAYPLRGNQSKPDGKSGHSQDLSGF